MDIYGHRGAAGEAPENTIAACLHALERGARFLEVDLRVSADDQFVIIHDANVNRTTGHRGRVNQLTAAELARLDARRQGPPWPRKRDCGIPTLDALFEATAQAKGYILEIKATKGISPGRMGQLVAERFPSSASVKKCVIMSMDMKILQEIRARAPFIPLGFISSNGEIVRRLKDYRFEHLSLHWSSCNPITTALIRRKGIKLSVWTVNDPQMIGTLRRMKVDNIITDYPSMALPRLACLTRK